MAGRNKKLDTYHKIIATDAARASAMAMLNIRACRSSRSRPCMEAPSTSQTSPLGNATVKNNVASRKAGSNWLPASGCR